MKKEEIENYFDKVFDRTKLESGIIEIFRRFKIEDVAEKTTKEIMAVCELVYIQSVESYIKQKDKNYKEINKSKIKEFQVDNGDIYILKENGTLFKREYINKYYPDIEDGGYEINEIGYCWKEIETEDTIENIRIKKRLHF